MCVVVMTGATKESEEGTMPPTKLLKATGGIFEMDDFDDNLAPGAVELRERTRVKPAGR